MVEEQKKRCRVTRRRAELESNPIGKEIGTFVSGNKIQDVEVNILQGLDGFFYRWDLSPFGLSLMVIRNRSDSLIGCGMWEGWLDWKPSEIWSIFYDKMRWN